MRRGPFEMVLATLMFSLMIASVKVARQELDALEVIVWRAVVSLPLSLALAWPTRLRIVNRRDMLLRGVFGFGAMACFFTSAKGLALADLSIIMKLVPILLALAAPYVVGATEKAEGKVWVAMGAGLVGCALIVGPHLRVGSVYGLWAVSAVLFTTGAHLMVRRLGATDDPRAVVFWFQVIVFTFALTGFRLLRGAWLDLPPPHLWIYLAATGLFATSGQVFMTRAYRMDSVPNVAAASYTGPVFGALLDLVVFGHWPSIQAIAGGTLVVGAGLWLVFGRGTPQPIPAQSE